MAASKPKGKTMSKEHEFLIESNKRVYTFRAASPELRDLWIAVINTIAPVSKDGARKSVTSRALGSPSRASFVRPRSSSSVSSSSSLRRKSTIN